MKAMSLIWIIPVTLVLGLILGFVQGVEVVIPEEITIETGDNYNEVLSRIENITDGISYKKLYECEDKLYEKIIKDDSLFNVCTKACMWDGDDDYLFDNTDVFDCVADCEMMYNGQVNMVSVE